MELGSVSGDVEFLGSADQLDVKTVSGAMILKLTALRGNGRMETTSGTVELTCEAPLNHEIKLTSTSGTLVLERPEANVKVIEDRLVEATAGSGQFTLELSTVSGNVSVK